jgi:hypothetical protein
MNEKPGAGSAPGFIVATGFFLLSRRKERFVRLLTGRVPNLPGDR